MFFLEFLEAVLVVLLGLLFLFQIILPIWFGTLLFPSFRRKARDLQRKLREARLNAELAKDQRKLEDLETGTAFYTKTKKESTDES